MIDGPLVALQDGVVVSLFFVMSRVFDVDFPRVLFISTLLVIVVILLLAFPLFIVCWVV